MLICMLYMYVNMYVSICFSICVSIGLKMIEGVCREVNANMYIVINVY